MRTTATELLQSASGSGKTNGPATKLLRVGIIGASAESGWARVSHVPAILNLAGLELAAVATQSQKSADAAAKAFGARAAYGDAADLFHDPDVDLVTICVKLPDHRELVLGALAAGKHVYCEWPLGRGVDESEELADAADATNVHTAVGLQLRANAVTLQAADLIASGAIGRVLSARVYSATAAWGRAIPAAMIYAEDSENATNLVTIQGAHTLDFAVAVLGALEDVTALATTQYPEITVGDDAAPTRRTTPDHLLVQSRFAGGAALSIEVAGGRPADAPFRFEAIGEDGVLTVDGGALRGFQAGRLRLSLNGALQTVDEGETKSSSDESANIAAMYAVLRDDISSGSTTVPDFRHAVRLARLVEDAMSSSRTGTREKNSEWPEQRTANPS